MSSLSKLSIMTPIIAVASIIVLTDYFTGIKVLDTVTNTLATWGVIIIAFSLTVALIRLAYSRGRKLIAREPKEWPFHALFLTVLFVQLFLGLVFGLNNYFYSNIWNSIQLSATSAMVATTALLLTSSAYRVFRARNKEAVILMAGAILVMIGQTTLGALIWNGFPTIRDWIWNYPAAASMRGIFLVTAIGLVALSLRMIVGISRPLAKK